MRLRPHSPRLYTTILYYSIQPYTAQSATIQYNELMKKNYIAPQTEAIELLASNVLMASPGGGFVSPHVGWGGDGYNGSGN